MPAVEQFPHQAARGNRLGEFTKETRKNWRLNSVTGEILDATLLQAQYTGMRFLKGDAIMDTKDGTECCPPFDPNPWQDKVVTWDKKLFLQDRVRSFLHIPLNFGAVMKRSMANISAAGAIPDQMIVLTDENSLWGADVYIAISKELPGARTTTLSGTYLTRVFEGPYRNIRGWISEMQSFVKSKGKAFQRLYFYYTTCPKCAKKYGKNYVVILARI
jgi:hypothetical protein